MKLRIFLIILITVVAAVIYNRCRVKKLPSCVYIQSVTVQRISLPGLAVSDSCPADDFDYYLVNLYFKDTRYEPSSYPYWGGLADSKDGQRDTIHNISAIDGWKRDITSSLIGASTLKCFQYDLIYIEDKDDSKRGYIPCRRFADLKSLAKYINSLDYGIIQEQYRSQDSTHIISSIFGVRKESHMPYKILIGFKNNTVEAKVNFQTADMDLKSIIPHGDTHNSFLYNIR